MAKRPNIQDSSSDGKLRDLKVLLINFRDFMADEEELMNWIFNKYEELGELLTKN